MEELNTRYGILNGISRIDYYEDGSIKECTLNSLNRLNSSYGTLVPQYEDGGIRRKHIESLSFYKNGGLKSIYLQKQIHVNTSIGIVPAEFMTFYENGDIKRIFPLNGKITAYWTEQDEYNLAEELEFDLSIGKLKQKVIGIYFYEGGSVKSITFWRGNNIKIHTPVGDVPSRIGVAFYEDGKIKSAEPGTNIAVKTKIGTIKAYNTAALGIHGDLNSLSFSREGEVESLITSTDRIEVTNKKTGEKQVYRPMLKQSIINENSMEVIPLNIEFQKNKVKFSNGFMHKFLSEYTIDEYDFNIKTLSLNINSPCSSCTGCSD